MECEPVNAHTTFALTLLCIASGCGTLANLNGQSYPLMGGTEPTKPLGGVRRDIGWITSVTAPVNLLFVADLPVSLIGDVVTLPRTLTASKAVSSHEEPTSTRLE